MPQHKRENPGICLVDHRFRHGPMKAINGEDLPANRKILVLYSVPASDDSVFQNDEILLIESPLPDFWQPVGDRRFGKSQIERRASRRQAGIKCFHSGNVFIRKRLNSDGHKLARIKAALSPGSCTRIWFLYPNSSTPYTSLKSLLSGSVD